MKPLTISFCSILCSALLAPHALAQADAAEAPAPAPDPEPGSAEAGFPDAPPPAGTAPSVAPGTGSVEASPAPDSAPAPSPGSAPVAEPAPLTEAGPSASASASASGSEVVGAPPGAAATANPSDAPQEPYLQRYRPKANLVEIGLYGGALFMAADHGLYDPDFPRQAYDDVSGEIGLRLAYFPASFFGLEMEGAAMPSGTDEGEKAGLWTVRGHLVVQLPAASLVPFLLVGGGVVGANSPAMGADREGGPHFGVGLKVPLDDFLSVRLDGRDTLLSQDNGDGQTHNPEVLLGVTFTLDRHPPRKPAVDTDADGVNDDTDACPEQAGVAPTGCPQPPDGDCDGVPDEGDPCPDVHGALGGCPAPAPECPRCPEPDPDPDGDGLLGPADQCPKATENKNGFQDTDGCPDEIPEEARKFMGVMQGIQFQFGSANIAAASYPVLDDAAKTLTEYPELRVRITGHTDNVGPRERNVALSQARADSVKAYLASKGIVAERLETRGAGPDEPVADNATAPGRQANRRIEFRIITQ